MTKQKLVTIFALVVAVLLIIPNVSNAATTYTYEDTEQGITWSYELDSSENVVNLICKTSSKQGAVTIPSTIDGKTVISIGNVNSNYYSKGDKSAFADCVGITSITIPDTITRIGKGAFYNCKGLTTITIPNSVIEIQKEAFYNCVGLTQITLSENITTIGSGAFENCVGLKTITIPSKVSQLSDYIFKECRGLTEITIPENILAIGAGAFEGCVGLRSIAIPNSVTSVGTYAFAECSGLREITLSEKLTSILGRTFYKCSGLTSVVIPDSVTSIRNYYDWGYGAFEDCSNLKKVLIPDTVASIDKGAFEGCNKLTIYGNDDQASKLYAEENKIPFDYIANWDKESSGADITAPTVESIIVTYESVMRYDKDANKNMYMVPANAKLVINVNFSEVIKGTSVPTLTIKFGDGENINVTEGTVGGSIITYIYTIKETDKGVMSTVSYSGGNITDESGNAATLSCPTLSVQYNSGDFVYANGTATNPGSGNEGSGNGNEGNAGSGNEGSGSGNGGNGGSGNEGSGNGNGGNSGSGNVNEGDGNKKDPSVAQKPYDKAGKEIYIVLAMLIILVSCAGIYVRYNKMRDI